MHTSHLTRRGLVLALVGALLGLGLIHDGALAADSPAPKRFTLVDRSPSELAFSWSPAASYKVKMSTSSSMTKPIYAMSSDASEKISGLKAGQTYYAKVVASRTRHHVQQQHPEWAFVLLDLSPHALRLAEETVSNEFAIQVLMPWDGDPLDSRNVHPADVMAGLFENSPASRSAVVHRVARLLPKEAKWILAVSDANGVVESAHTTYVDPQPAKASNQPGFAAVANEAELGPVRRNFAEGIQYSTGSQLHEMRAEAVLDPDGRYLFVALTPAARFGTGRMIWPTFECSSPSCGNTFDAKYVKLVWCEKCGDPHCTRCNRCGCDPTDTGRTCPSCNIRLTQAEVELGNHECW